MKISDLIGDIVSEAEIKFGISGHMNDSISVFIWTNWDEEGVYFQVGLERPTRRQLDSGEVEAVDTIKVSEKNTAFRTSHPSLLKALLILRDKIDEVNPEDWSV